MTVSEAQTPESDNERSARVIPFPRGVFEITEQQQGPFVERQQARAEFPTSKQFLASMRENDVSSDTTGAQVMMLLYESLDLIPKKKEVDELTQLISSLKKLLSEYNALLTEDVKGARLTSFKSKLKTKGLTLDNINPATIEALEQQLAKTKGERAPLQDLTDTVERNYREFLSEKGDSRGGDFSDKIEAIYDATDEFEEGDELLELAQAVRKDAMQTTDKGLVIAARTFERFTRFMIFDDNRTAAKFERQSDTNQAES
ncbi:MAG: hypothetical protein U0491_02635 [Candidatus Saccharimonadales bacterium]